MTKARAFLSEETIRRISSGETVTIRVAEMVEIEVSKKPPSGIPHPNLKKAKGLLDSIIGEGRLDKLLDDLFGKGRSL